MKPSAQPRTYRHQIKSHGLVSFNVTVKETDLFIRTQTPLRHIAMDSVVRHRAYLERFIAGNPTFASSLAPWMTETPAPEIVREMITAGLKAQVGPMAAVAGGMAQQVGMDLLSHSGEVIVENGGDVFVKTDAPITVGVYAGNSPLSLRIGITVDAVQAPVAVCTSSGTVGHSISFGKADAVCVISGNCALADAAATAIGNRVNSENDIAEAVVYGKGIDGVQGLLIIVGDRMGAWGQVALKPLSSASIYR